MVDVDISVQLRDVRWKSLLRPYCKTASAACGAALAATRLARIPCRFEMAVVLADDDFIHELNRTWRGKDKATNVLSFPAVENLESCAISLCKGADSFELGDIVLALETVQREAKEQNKTFRDHATHLLVHGTLHLLGYDHEKKAEGAKMEKLEIKILRELDVSNPYL